MPPYLSSQSSSFQKELKNSDSVKLLNLRTCAAVGMDSQCITSREDVQSIQTDLKHVQAVQINHSDRLLKIEKRQADDAALKSVWGTSTAFPNVLSGTPQPDITTSLNDDVFDKFDGEQGQHILRSLQLEGDDEPVRRGASRANSVRFDVTALQNSSWTVPARNSGDFVSTRSSNGFETHSMMERTLSHKSDGRRSSAGHSLPDFYSVASGRTSSLGLDTNFVIGDDHDDDSPNETPDPPPGIFILGSVPSIIRCWLTTDFSHDSLLYAAVCSGSQRSVLHYKLVKDLGLQDLVHKDHSGRNIIKLSLYLPEAIIIHPLSRSNSLMSQLPILSVNFEIVGMNQHSFPKKSIYIFIGSDTLREHNADIFFSQNLMKIYGDDRSKLSIPFVRPEDDETFKNLCVTNLPPEKFGLKATAIPFTPTAPKQKVDSTDPFPNKPVDCILGGNMVAVKPMLQQTVSIEPVSSISPKSSDSLGRSTSLSSVGTALGTALAGLEINSQKPENRESPVTNSEITEIGAPGTGSRKSSNAIWGPWRQEGSDAWSHSGYQPATHGANRSMKILKPSSRLTSAPIKSASLLKSECKSSSPSNRTIPGHESPPLQLQSKYGAEQKRKNNYINGSGRQEDRFYLRWDKGRKSNFEEAEKLNISKNNFNGNYITSLENSSNPIGGASAFAWMNSEKAKGSVSLDSITTTASGNIA